MAAYRGPRADEVATVPLDSLTAVFHRPSGATHLLASPATELIGALTGATLNRAALLAALDAQYRIEGVGELDNRLDELVAAGLVERV